MCRAAALPPPETAGPAGAGQFSRTAAYGVRRRMECGGLMECGGADSALAPRGSAARTWLHVTGTPDRKPCRCPMPAWVPHSIAIASRRAGPPHRSQPPEHATCAPRPLASALRPPGTSRLICILSGQYTVIPPPRTPKRGKPVPLPAASAPAARPVLFVYCPDNRQ